MECCIAHSLEQMPAGCNLMTSRELRKSIPTRKSYRISLHNWMVISSSDDPFRVPIHSGGPTGESMCTHPRVVDMTSEPPRRSCFDHHKIFPYIDDAWIVETYEQRAREGGIRAMNGEPQSMRRIPRSKHDSRNDNCLPSGAVRRRRALVHEFVGWRLTSWLAAVPNEWMALE